MPGAGLFLTTGGPVPPTPSLAICPLYSASPPSQTTETSGLAAPGHRLGCPGSKPRGSAASGEALAHPPTPRRPPLPRDDETPGSTPMELEAEPLPEPSLEPTVPPPEGAVSPWRRVSEG